MYVEQAWISLYWIQSSYLPELLESGHQQFYYSKALVPIKKRPAGRFSLMLIYNLVAIATHDPEEGQEVGEDVVDV